MRRAEVTAGGWLPSADGPVEEGPGGDDEPEPEEGDSWEQPLGSRRQDARMTADATAGRARGRPPLFVNELSTTIAILDQRLLECQSYESRWLVQEM
jgi:hypothetical protein